MSEKGLLVVSFGTSFQEAFTRDILPVENALAAAFPDYVMTRAFGSGMIIRKLKERDCISVPTVEEALEEFCQMGIKEVLIQPTFLIHGIEYDRMMEAIEKVKERFEVIRVGKPLMSSPEDYMELAHCLAELFPKEQGALLLMGHGTEHFANMSYPAMESVFRNEGYDYIYLGTVEGYPDLDMIRKKMRSANIKKATLTPLMLVAGDHACNDMASDEPDSWKSLLTEDGIEVKCVIRGLGSYKCIQKMFAEHALQAEEF